MLGIGMSLMTMAMIVNLAYTFLDKLVNQMGDSPNLGTMGALMVALFVVAFLSNSVPKMVGQLATGVHHGVGNLSLAASGLAALSTTGLFLGGVGGAIGGGAAKAIRSALEGGPYDPEEWDRGKGDSEEEGEEKAA